MAFTEAQSHATPPETQRKFTPRIHARLLPVDDEALVKLPTVLAVFPVSRTSWWRGCKDGRFPAGIKVGPRTTMWRSGAIRALLNSLAPGTAA